MSLNSSYFRRALVEQADVKNAGKSHFFGILTLDERDVAQAQIKQISIFLGLVHQSHIVVQIVYVFC